MDTYSFVDKSQPFSYLYPQKPEINNRNLQDQYQNILKQTKEIALADN